jgi:transcription elongation GreA/GreB family factor
MERKISDDSPFGRAMVGKAIGDKFTVNAPAGSYTMEIVNITREN